MPMVDKDGNRIYYRLIDGNITYDEPCAHCSSKHGYMNISLVKVHQCLRKNCKCLTRMEHPVWEERKRKKRMAKEKRREWKHECLRVRP